MSIALSSDLQLLSSVTVTGAGSARPQSPAPVTFQATVTGSGTVSATVAIEVSNDGDNFITLGTITLSGTTTATDGFASAANWSVVRANCTAISGTSAALSVVMGA